MSRYEALTRFLESRHEVETPLKFADIERILDRPLPASARQHQPWWANSTSHSQADAWMRAGWKTSRVDLAEERVVFLRDDVQRGAAPTAPSGSQRPPGGAIAIDQSKLSGSAMRLLEDYCDGNNCDPGAAAAALLNAMAIARRRELVAWFEANSPLVPGDSTDLIREDRDAR